MKKIKYIIALCALLGFTACDNNSIEDLSGEFSNISFCTFNSATVQPTDKVGKGIKALNTSYTDATGNSLTLRFGSKECIAFSTLFSGLKYFWINRNISFDFSTL